MKSGAKLKIVKAKTSRFPMDIKDDDWYLEGYQEGLKIAQARLEYEKDFGIVTRFLQTTDCTNERITFLINVPLSFVEKVEMELEKQKAK
jgi:hypothetical protein